MPHFHLRLAGCCLVALTIQAAAQEPPECETKRATIRAGEMMCNDFKNAQACALLAQERRAAAALGCGSGGAEGGANSPPGAPTGVIGDPGALSRERVYDDQCVRKVPRTDTERAQCQQLYRAINPATNRGPSAPPPSRGGEPYRRDDAGPGGVPVDQHGRECITLADETAERWGSNNVNRHYYFRNGCNVAMEVSAEMAQHDGSTRGASNYVCPGKTEKLVCLSFNGGASGCSQMTRYRVRPSPGIAETCRARR